MKYFTITLWLNHVHPVRHGYTPSKEEETATFRVGPLVIGWEVVKA